MRSPPSDYRSPLADGIRSFLSVRRALGRKYLNEQKSLRLLDRFLVDRGVERVNDITPVLLDEFLASRPRPRPRSFNALLSIVRCLLDWLVAQRVLKASPLTTSPRTQTSKRLPYLFDADQARQLLAVAGALPDRPKGPQRGPTYRTLFALLYGLGLRVSEACGLSCGDVDLQKALLLVRGGKFGKERLVPFGPRMSDLMREQLGRRQPAGGAADPSAPLFSFNGGRRVHPGTVSQTFLHLTRKMKLVVPNGGSRPHLHDLRHSFAVGTLLRWYRQGVDPGARLLHLATFMGHVDPTSTAEYLTITEDLLREANRRFEAFAARSVQEGGS